MQPGLPPFYIKSESDVYSTHPSSSVIVEVDPGDIETSITNIQEQLNTPVEDAVRDKVISSGSVTIDTENLNILVDEKLDINITYVPMGHVREMNLTFAVENPYAAS